MKQITKEQLKEIVSSLMIEPTEQVLDNIIENWNNIQNELKKFDKINLDNVAPLSHINETPLIDFLREDYVDNSFSISKEDILKNAKDKDQDFIITSKVVK
ncbi:MULTISPECIES: aspartyl/glutamyl-tRNA amidotransferase subunit C [unclassified Mycoplasma]|uniref:Asp-tRNA(Asn)/Glu-tRNA(Gln) amidotransferase subunit GatC n=1 Tax=unclassified Mycoplasma TaxID=2683645 RepID=UPI00211BAC23|nr:MULTISPECIES: Asp-tRNA(Asn)/Glu-tRNA(Gln) amidotransferase subunit GatC [unclassified Mycoplasma]UUM19938.1 aspartyl/glutamyl-tRNA amidotransferase subunit C [Mycoplasma sp. 1578d]UUM24919.1 aspartyl/glutamyl-tRNA amidotransferase subunit C [Mycoplasma sp. 3686d]